MSNIKGYWDIYRNYDMKNKISPYEFFPWHYGGKNGYLKEREYFVTKDLDGKEGRIDSNTPPTIGNGREEPIAGANFYSRLLEDDQEGFKFKKIDPKQDYNLETFGGLDEFYEDNYSQNTYEAYQYALSKEFIKQAKNTNVPLIDHKGFIYIKIPLQNYSFYSEPKTSHPLFRININALPMAFKKSKETDSIQEELVLPKNASQTWIKEYPEIFDNLKLDENVLIDQDGSHILVYTLTSDYMNLDEKLSSSDHLFIWLLRMTYFQKAIDPNFDPFNTDPKSPLSKINQIEYLGNFEDLFLRNLEELKDAFEPLDQNGDYNYLKFSRQHSLSLSKVEEPRTYNDEIKAAKEKNKENEHLKFIQEQNNYLWGENYRPKRESRLNLSKLNLTNSRYIWYKNKIIDKSKDLEGFNNQLNQLNLVGWGNDYEPFTKKESYFSADKSKETDFKR
ncbi:hypothetical protein JXZ92_01230 [Mycoplasma sp. CSL10137]|uniref:hypothetical protein n=1 Tax=Mycoplasma sp. CSL10137 TaxID=2813824 RepID=UPI00197C4A43|nr:hypothetical protein [Mycoplasma sp. CSL10137]MBN4083443.1 hypothetical protein [Mycoplasma sp. CSL10137]